MSSTKKKKSKQALQSKNIRIAWTLKNSVMKIKAQNLLNFMKNIISRDFGGQGGSTVSERKKNKSQAVLGVGNAVLKNDRKKAEQLKHYFASIFLSMRIIFNLEIIKQIQMKVKPKIGEKVEKENLDFKSSQFQIQMNYMP